jgi:predicted nucleic acid-binding protein
MEAKPVVISDACCLINLYAAGDLASLLRGIGWPVYVSVGVVAEAYYTLVPDEEEQSRLIPVPIDLSPAIDQGVLKTCEVSGDEEAELFVRLASTLDDGEAGCLAIAKVRGWSLATDDRKATHLATDLGVLTITTPELMKRWADCARPDAGSLTQAIRNIQTYARFVPRPGSPLSVWWSDQTD